MTNSVTFQWKLEKLAGVFINSTPPTPFSETCVYLRASFASFDFARLHNSQTIYSAGPRRRHTFTNLCYFPSVPPALRSLSQSHLGYRKAMQE